MSNLNLFLATLRASLDKGNRGIEATAHGQPTRAAAVARAVSYAAYASERLGVAIIVELVPGERDRFRFLQLDRS